MRHHFLIEGLDLGDLLAQGFAVTGYVHQVSVQGALGRAQPSLKGGELTVKLLELIVARGDVMVTGLGAAVHVVIAKLTRELMTQN